MKKGIKQKELKMGFICQIPEDAYTTDQIYGPARRGDKERRETDTYFEAAEAVPDAEWLKETEGKSRFYIFTYPSSWGMGSDSDHMLVSHSSLRRMILTELAKKNRGDRFCDRLTGMWNQEAFCDSKDPEEVVADVIEKRLSDSSTYSDVNDLILVPEWVPAMVRKKNMKNKIFPVWNQWGFRRDIIAGSASFTRYFLDLTGMQELGILGTGLAMNQDSWYEFTCYHIERVLELHYVWSRRQSVIKTEKNRYERMIDHMKNEKGEGSETREIVTAIQRSAFTGLSSEVTGEDGEETEKEKKYAGQESGKPEQADTEMLDWYTKLAAMSAANLKKLEQPLTGEDCYRDFIYRDRMDAFVEANLEGDKHTDIDSRDYLDSVYEYPLAPEENGAYYTHHRETADKYTYDELFQKGMDVTYLPASLTDSGSRPDRFGRVAAFRTLRTVFGYD